MVGTWNNKWSWGTSSVSDIISSGMTSQKSEPLPPNVNPRIGSENTSYIL